MKIHDAQIDKFGIWQGLQLPLNVTGLSVIYGPNETGKSTLVRFLSGMLFGFSDARNEKNSLSMIPVCSGSLGFLHEHRELRIARESKEAGQDMVTVTGGNRISPGEETLSGILGNVNCDVYTNVFAVGLNELQKLATLQEPEIAELIYGTSLAPEGRLLLDAINSVESLRDQLFHPEQPVGQLVDLLERESQLKKELEELGDPRARHAELRNQEEELSDGIAELRSRRSGMRSQLRGHRFLERLQAPWQQVQEYRISLKECPNVQEFPDQGLLRLDEIDKEIDSETHCRNLLKKELAELKKTILAIPLDQAARENASEIRAIVEKKTTFASLDQQIAELEQQSDQLKKQLDESLDNIGPDWSLQRLDVVDSGPQAQHNLLEAAKNFQEATIRWGRFRGLYNRLSRSCRKMKNSLKEYQDLNQREGQDAGCDSQEQMANLAERMQLSQRERELTSRLEIIQGNQLNDEPQSVMPVWFSRVLLVFAAAGSLAFFSGLLSGFLINAISGVILALVGLTGVGIAKGLHLQVSRTNKQTKDFKRNKLRETELRLQETRRAIRQLSTAEHTCPASEIQSTSETEQITQTIERILKFERYQIENHQFQTRRQRLVKLRLRIPVLQNNVSETRQHWCKTLTAMELDENLRIPETFEAWQEITQAITLRDALRTQSDELETIRRNQFVLIERITELEIKLDDSNSEQTDLVSKIDRWKHRLNLDVKSREQRRLLIRDFRVRRREKVRYSKHLRQLNCERSALLVQGGAVDREEFEQRDGFVKQRAELQELISLSEEELRQAGATEPELAVVEEDLVNCEPSHNLEYIQVLESELSEIESNLQSLHEELGRTKQSIAELEQDRRTTILRHQLASVQNLVKEATQEWLGLRLAKRVLNTIRQQYERHRQPETLEKASHYFRRLTNGQYDNLWTPLGEQNLIVDDTSGESCRIEQLSQGTREQLFLAIRLAMIEQFREQEIELPVILDDVLVNFDQHRAQAAVQTLQEIAESGQQILFFTCHQHLAELFQRSGNEIINLPELANPTQKRIAG